MRVDEVMPPVELSTLAFVDACSLVLAAAVERDHKSVLERRRQVGAGGMRQMMRDGNDPASGSEEAAAPDCPGQGSPLAVLIQIGTKRT
jgi:hypothetical protein